MKVLLQFVDRWEKIIDISLDLYIQGQVLITISPPMGKMIIPNNKAENIEIAKVRFIRTEEKKYGLTIFKYY